MQGSSTSQITFGIVFYITIPDLMLLTKTHDSSTYLFVEVAFMIFGCRIPGLGH